MAEGSGGGAPTLEEFEAVAGRLDRVVAEVSGMARAEAQRAIAGGRVLVNGRPRPKSFPLVGGERISVDVATTSALPAEGPAVPVRHEDDWIAVVAKPPGMPTHPTASRRDGTLVNSLLAMQMPLAPETGPDRPGIVHRLDAGTSGLLVVAKRAEVVKRMQDLFREHRVERVYLALVRGVVEHDRFAVQADLARRRDRIVVRSGAGRSSETVFVIEERFEVATLLRAAPLTGRTHQIRVHLSAAGHPILGDRRYGGGGDLASDLRLDRPFLHSWRIRFAHPMIDREIEIQEALPEDLDRALRRLRNRSGRNVSG